MVDPAHVRTPTPNLLLRRGDPQRVPAHWQQTRDGLEAHVPEQFGEVVGWHYDTWADGVATHILRSVAAQTA